MVKIVIGTTPTIRYKFSIVDPSDFVQAILTIKDSREIEKIRKTLDTATVGTNYIEWTLTQEETLALGAGWSALSMMLNWLTNGGTRGASAEESVVVVNNHIGEVMSGG